MSLLIACILIYRFDLPGWMYAVAAATFVTHLTVLHLWESTQTRNTDARFNNLNSLIQQELDQVRASIPDRQD